MRVSNQRGGHLLARQRSLQQQDIVAGIDHNHAVLRVFTQDIAVGLQPPQRQLLNGWHMLVLKNSFRCPAGSSPGRY